MANISQDDIHHLAQLSALSLDDGEAELMTKEISAIMTYIEQLDEIDTEGVQPTYQVTGLHNQWRTDAVELSTVTKAQLLDLAPEQAHGQIKVPKVL